MAFSEFYYQLYCKLVNIIYSILVQFQISNLSILIDYLTTNNKLLILIALFLYNKRLSIKSLI